MKTASNVKTKASTGSGTSGAYALITPGFYTARVVSGEKSSFQAAYKGQSGKFDYIKLTPEIVLLNDAGTRINRQDIVLGAVDENGALFRPDGNEEKPALFSDAGFFLSAVGFIDGDGNIDIEGFYPDLLSGQIIKVKIGHEDYVDKHGEKKVKNVIVNFYPPKLADVEEHELYFDDDTGMVFDSAEASDAYHALAYEVLNSAEYGDDGPF